MKSFVKPFPLGLLAFFAISIGLYPFVYLIIDMSAGLLASKSDALINEPIYLLGFYTHILGGGLALLIGWAQFFPKLRKKHLKLHQTSGKIYVLAVGASGIAGLGISFFATGGLIAASGFFGLALAWLISTWSAYAHIKKKEIDAHQRWMIRSYALCFAAVTLRIYLPLFTAGFHMDFIPAYQIIAWLCWVPNLAFAEWIIRSYP
ncbi:MAG: DUF2306 domain-containing protein [Saprospiraceae bacterium]|nr:DUF2306 domain-containing protein [Saprospiraceae bacterium]